MIVLFHVQAHAVRASEQDYVFDLSALPSVTVELTVAQWNQLLTNYDRNQHNEEYVSASFRFEKNGVIETKRGVEMRIKGNSSRRRPERNPDQQAENMSWGYMHNSVNPLYKNANFKIKFGKDNLFHGLRALGMKWFRLDPAYCRDVYACDLMRRFDVWTAPRASYAKFYIKIGNEAPAYFGIYEMGEPIDKEYLQDRFGSNDDGFLWKCGHNHGQSAVPTMENAADLQSNMGVEYVDPASDDASIYYGYTLQTEEERLGEAKRQLNEFIVRLNTLTDNELRDWALSAMDVDLFLRTMAVSVAIGNWDGYWGNHNNYYLYFDEDEGRLYFIEYDFDNSLGTCLNEFGGNKGLSSIYDYSSHAAPLVDRLLAVPEFRRQYTDHMIELISETNDYFAHPSSFMRLLDWWFLIHTQGEWDQIDVVADDKNNWLELKDAPSPGSSTPFYMLFFGGDTGAGPHANFFKTRAKCVKQEIDPNPPTWKKPLPSVSMIKGRPMLSAGLNEEGSVYYVVVPLSESSPSIRQIMRGENAEGQAPVFANHEDNLPAGARLFPIRNVQANRWYKVLLVGKDRIGNIQSAATSVTFYSAATIF